MKKILYITTVSGTINAFLVPHIEMLLENGYKVDCATSINIEISKKLTDKGVKVFNIPFNRNPLNISNIKAFKELINIQKENNYDIIHVHTPVASIYGRLLKLRFSKLKTIYTVHGYHFFKGGPKIGWLVYYPIEKIMAKLTDITITINEEDYEITKKKLRPGKCYWINGVGIDLNKYKPLSKEKKQQKRDELALKDDDFIVIMIAELNKNKNQIQLIKAIEVLKDEYPNIKAICVGAGPCFDLLQKEINERFLQDNVKLLGFRTDINELINISNIGVLLSYREGLPRNIMEIIANGKNVITTNIRGCKDINCNNNIGKMVNIGDYKQTAKFILEYYNNSEKIEKNNFCEKYSIDNINKQLRKILEEEML